MDLLNFTGRLERGEAFVRAKAALVCTQELSVHIKFTRARGRDINGYYRWKDQRMSTIPLPQSGTMPQLNPPQQA